LRSNALNQLNSGKGQDLVSPEKGHDKGPWRSNTLNQLNAKKGQDLVSPEKGHDKGPFRSNALHPNVVISNALHEIRRNKKKSSNKISKEEDKDVMNNDDVNIDHGSDAEPRTISQSANSNRQQGRRVVISKDTDANSDEDKETRIEKRNSSRQRQQQQAGSAQKTRTEWTDIDEYIGSWKSDLPEIFEP